MNTLSRRALLAGTLAAGVGGAACDRNGRPGLLRIAVLSNLTHGPMLAGLESGRVKDALGGMEIEVRVFRAGPRVLEALMGGAIDVGVSGPAPVVTTQARHGDGTLRVLSGCASGGASFVVTKTSGITGPEDLHGRALAVNQVGSTQDVSLKKYLRKHGLETTNHGGDVTVHVLAPSDIRTQMMRGQIEGAWLPEPWPTRLAGDLGTIRLIDERDLWPNRRFSSAMLVARSVFAEARRADLGRLVTALGAEVARANLPDSPSRAEAHAQIQKLTRNAGPRPLFDKAWTWIDFTTDPLAEQVQAFAEDALELGLISRAGPCRSLFGAA